ncbi:hypothetical protein LZC95_07795 [Pendulispora brunnea]|uniref:Uncharacterized protein n=1 Tax=Pendulispora brunnea TaxID=2905690 RepID=A0ABZ2KDG1_9BACT
MKERDNGPPPSDDADDWANAIVIGQTALNQSAGEDGVLVDCSLLTRDLFRGRVVFTSRAFRLCVCTGPNPGAENPWLAQRALIALHRAILERTAQRLIATTPVVTNQQRTLRIEFDVPLAWPDGRDIGTLKLQGVIGRERDGKLAITVMIPGEGKGP